MLSVHVLHYGAVCLTIILPIIGVALGQGLASKAAIDAIDEQPATSGALNRLFMVALALTETAALSSALLAGLIFMSSATKIETACAHMGAAIALALPATLIGFLSAFPIRAALRSVARQPLVAPKIFNLLLLAVSMAQTPIIFGLLVGFFVVQKGGDAASFADGLRLLASGLALGIGSLGPSIGLALFGSRACAGVGRNREAYDRV